MREVKKTEYDIKFMSELKRHEQKQKEFELIKERFRKKFKLHSNLQNKLNTRIDDIDELEEIYKCVADRERKKIKEGESMFKLEYQSKRKELEYSHLGNRCNHSNEIKQYIDLHENSFKEKGTITDLTLAYVNKLELLSEDPFDIIYDIDIKYLSDYLHLCDKVKFTQEDERKFKQIFKKICLRNAKSVQSKYFNKDRFDLTTEISKRKENKWWSKMKYKLIKLANSKHHMFLLQSQHECEDKLSNINLHSISLRGKLGKNQKAVNTELDILSILEKLKIYYDKVDEKSKSQINPSTSIRSLQDKNECLRLEEYKKSIRDELNNRDTGFLNIEEPRSKSVMVDEGMQTIHNRNLNIDTSIDSDSLDYQRREHNDHSDNCVYK